MYVGRCLATDRLVCCTDEHCAGYVALCRSLSPFALWNLMSRGELAKPIYGHVIALYCAIFVIVLYQGSVQYYITLNKMLMHLCNKTATDFCLK